MHPRIVVTSMCHSNPLSWQEFGYVMELELKSLVRERSALVTRYILFCRPGGSGAGCRHVDRAPTV